MVILMLSVLSQLKKVKCILKRERVVKIILRRGKKGYASYDRKVKKVDIIALKPWKSVEKRKEKH